MKRRQVLKSVGVGSIGAGALVGTGGYSLVKSQRQVRIDVGEKEECVDCTEGGDATRLVSLTLKNIGQQSKDILVEQRVQGSWTERFSGEVAPGETFTVDEIGPSQGTPNLRFTVDGEVISVEQDGDEDTEFHISCSKTIEVGQLLHPDQSPGSELQVVSGIDNNGFAIC